MNILPANGTAEALSVVRLSEDCDRFALDTQGTDVTLDAEQVLVVVGAVRFIIVCVETIWRQLLATLCVHTQCVYNQHAHVGCHGSHTRKGRCSD